jgi:hypothetical protein
MLTKIARPLMLLLRPVIFVISRVFRFFAWLQGSANPNRNSRSYRAHQDAIERRRRHR